VFAVYKPVGSSNYENDVTAFAKKVTLAAVTAVV
jgi:hypothetical protein